MVRFHTHSLLSRLICLIALHQQGVRHELTVTSNGTSYEPQLVFEAGTPKAQSNTAATLRDVHRVAFIISLEDGNFPKIVDRLQWGLIDSSLTRFQHLESIQIICVYPTSPYSTYEGPPLQDVFAEISRRMPRSADAIVFSTSSRPELTMYDWGPDVPAPNETDESWSVPGLHELHSAMGELESLLEDIRAEREAAAPVHTAEAAAESLAESEEREESIMTMPTREEAYSALSYHLWMISPD